MSKEKKLATELYETLAPMETSAFKFSKESVFLGRVVEKIYTLENCEKHFNGHYWNKPYIKESNNTIRREEVLRIKINDEFKKDEEIYIKELGKYTTIDKKTKSTDGSIVYNINYISKYENQDKSSEQYKELKNKLSEELIKYEEDLKQTKIEEDENRKRYLQDKKQSELEYTELIKRVTEKCENTKELKGVLIQTVPFNKDNKPIISLQEAEKIHYKTNDLLPDGYISILTPLATSILKLDDDNFKLIKKELKNK